jgi:hypothetical protein
MPLPPAISHVSRRARRIALLAAIAIPGLGCFGSDPDALERLGSLVSPHGAEGAAVIELTGGDIARVRVDEGQVFVKLSGTTTRMVIILNDPGPITFRLTLASKDGPPITGRVIDVADGNDNPRPSLSDYRVEVSQ